MKNYYLTFGQNHPAKNGYWRVRAPSHAEARKRVIAEYGMKWSSLYREVEWKPEYFPAGELGVMEPIGYGGDLYHN